MAARPLTPELYEQLKNYFRTHPGDHQGAARATGIDWRFARRAYRGPPWKVWPWAPPIQAVLAEEEQRAARAKHDLEIQRRAALADTAQRQRELEAEANQVEENILRVARNDVLGGLVTFAKLVNGIGKLAERVNTALERGAVAQRDPATGAIVEVPLNLDVLDALKVMGRFSLSARALIGAADTVLTMQRLRGGLPTSIVGVELANVSLEDAEREVELAKHALERAKELGLVVHKGGRPEQDGDYHFDRTAADRR
jgi:hypothetical protein